MITDSGEVVSKITTTGLGITGGLFVATMLMVVFNSDTHAGGSTSP